MGSTFNIENDPSYPIEKKVSMFAIPIRKSPTLSIYGVKFQN